MSGVVAAAVIVLNDQVLLTQRSEKTSFSGRWELPGGSVEKGETAQEAVIREVEEELSITVRLQSDLPIFAGPLGQGDKSWYICFFHCSLGSPDDVNRIKLAPQVSAWRWFPLNEDPNSAAYPCLNGTGKVFERLRRILHED